MLVYLTQKNRLLWACGIDIHPIQERDVICQSVVFLV